jgi:dinuclear metal center YbgI/SA1388 family protein
MTVGDIARVLESWAPRWAAWERDNVGLQIGDRTQQVRRVLVALEMTDAVLREAEQRKADLIVTHHPLLFRPPASLVEDEPIGHLLLALARQGISLYAAHTNLDFTKDGVSVALAEELGLSSIRFLKPLPQRMAKIAVFVPETHVAAVREAMAREGAGLIGEYSECSFEIKGTGTFRGSERSRPTVGTRGNLEHAPEVRLEMILPRDRANAVVAGMKSVHPYEEVAFDLFELQNEAPNHGMGAVGELQSRQPLEAFLRTVKQRLHAPVLRYAGDPALQVRRVAVCGGSGSDLLPEAVTAGADVLVTADVKYHRFHDAAGRIALVDAGHWETERVILPRLASRLAAAAAELGEQLSVTVTEQNTNPVHIL